ncbi:MAG: hypothetical protein ACLF0P_11215 [Thermoanaerobaculia bacterium]
MSTDTTTTQLPESVVDTAVALMERRRKQLASETLGVGTLISAAGLALSAIDTGLKLGDAVRSHRDAPKHVIEFKNYQLSDNSGCIGILTRFDTTRGWLQEVFQYLLPEDTETVELSADRGADTKVHLWLALVTADRQHTTAEIHFHYNDDEGWRPALTVNDNTYDGKRKYRLEQELDIGVKLGLFGAEDQGGLSSVEIYG